MCAIFHGHWLRGDGWMGRGRIDSILSLFPLPILSCFSPSSTTSQFSCCAALSSGGIPSYQTKCIRTFSVQIWKFLWPLCLKFWFQSSKQWRTSCSKDCCHPHKQKVKTQICQVNDHKRYPRNLIMSVSFSAPPPPLPPSKSSIKQGISANVVELLPHP